MKTYHCDILVLGAGPAGSSAAYAAARRGVDVMIVEQRPIPGSPVQCAEYIPAPLLAKVDLGRNFVVQPVRGMKTHLPGGEVKETTAPGFMINRDQFDQTLASAAVEAGARLMLSTRGTSYQGETVILKEKDGSHSSVYAEVIIGADGPHTQVGRWIESENRNLIPAAQVKFALTRPLEFTEVYFDKKIYGGYGWLFPKNHEANIGLGLKRRKENPESLNAVLDSFVTRLIREGKIEGSPYDHSAGWIPAEPVREVTRDNILLTGDAAGHTHPITGAGIFASVVCGRMAGKWASRAVKEGNIDLLKEYEYEWRDLLGETIDRAYQRRQFMEQEWDRLDEIIKYCWVTFREYYGRAE